MASANAYAAVGVSSANSAATGPNGAQQLDMGSRNTPVGGNQSSGPHDIAQTSSGFAPSAVAKPEFVEQELIPPTSRLSRVPPATVPSTHSSANVFDSVAISAFQNNSNTYTSQDVHLFVNSSTSHTPSSAPRNFGQSSTSLETPVSSSSQPPSHHVLTHPIRRPRTSHIFQSSKDLAAHYGIPQILPPAPRTQHIPPSAQHPAPPAQPAQLDFHTLSANYLSMLSQKPTENTMAATSTSTMSTVTPADLEAPVIPTDEPSALNSFEDIFGEHTASRPPYSDFLTHTGSDVSASPEFRDNNDDFMINLFTPSMPDLDDFDTSPFETPYNDFLSTPLFTDDAMLTSPSMEFLDDRPMFGGIDYSKAEDIPVQSKEQQQPEQPLYTISPNLDSPFVDFNAGHSFPPLPSFPAPSATTTAEQQSATARRSKATGIRKGITPDALLDEDAPTQPRKYVTPSATSRKAVPAAFQRKRSRSTAFGEEEDQLDDLPLNPTEQDLVEQKRRQNTVAARRSRKRKLEEFQRMKDERDEESRVKEIWKTRALTMQAQLQSLGAGTYNYRADEFDS